MDRKELITFLEHYDTSFPEEQLYIPRFRSLLYNFRDCFTRSLTTGHITASAWILDTTRESALLVHHRKLNRWLQPGGHADGQEDVIAVAMKEAEEETGLTFLQLAHEGIFDIDIHQIPTHKDVTAHFHYDIRFLFYGDINVPLIVSHESHDVKWFNLQTIQEMTNDSASIGRMVCKSQILPSASS